MSEQDLEHGEDDRIVDSWFLLYIIIIEDQGTEVAVDDVHALLVTEIDLVPRNNAVCEGEVGR
ncbi:MAG: hypothetical protein EBX37_13130 [Alphaproteobacteria bacterium]|nr:hypothetical protein [Alphaproteobacteria bacterium]